MVPANGFLTCSANECVAFEFAEIEHEPLAGSIPLRELGFNHETTRPDSYKVIYEFTLPSKRQEVPAAWRGGSPMEFVLSYEHHLRYVDAKRVLYFRPHERFESINLQGCPAVLYSREIRSFRRLLITMEFVEGS